MAEINKIVEYLEQDQILIEVLLDDPLFSFRDWSSSELLSIRKAIRMFYRSEQSGICAYCRHPVSLQSASNCHIEHIAPKSIYRNFIFEPKNLCVVCADCNEIKRELETIDGNIDTIKNGKRRKQYPRSSNAFKIFHPHFDIYNDHIEVLGNSYYLDKTKKGHYTIGACKLNRKLHKFGWVREVIEDVEISTIMNDFLIEKSQIKKGLLLQRLRKLLILS